MESIAHELRQAAAKLRLSPSEMRELPEPENADVVTAVLSNFVKSGHRRWWWEDFREPGVARRFHEGDGWKRIPGIVPDCMERIWFMAEDGRVAPYRVYETTPETASALVGECSGFEYYLVAKNLSWLICENHHHVVIAIGDQVEQQLAASAG